MKILNVMLSRELGGIEQAFINYSDALQLEGLTVVNVTSVFAKINKFVTSHWRLMNLGPWDLLSQLYLKLIILITQPDIMIAHGNRAINFVTFISLSTSLPLIGVAHNYNLKYLKKCNYLIALTKHMHKYLIQQHFPQDKIFVIPNMIHVTQSPIVKEYRDPVVIGCAARLVAKKGIYVLLNSLAKLKRQRYRFKLLIGGEGRERSNLLTARQNLGLTDNVEFIGWVTNKRQFFQAIDIFVLPSLHEPFGITVLEAMISGVPIIATKTEGPGEIIRDLRDGLLCKINCCEDLAKKISYLIDNPTLAKRYAKSSYLRVLENYSTQVVAKKLVLHLNSIIKT